MSGSVRVKVLVDSPRGGILPPAKAEVAGSVCVYRLSVVVASSWRKATRAARTRHRAPPPQHSHSLTSAPGVEGVNIVRRHRQPNAGSTSGRTILASLRDGAKSHP